MIDTRGRGVGGAESETLGAAVGCRRIEDYGVVISVGGGTVDKLPTGGRYKCAFKLLHKRSGGSDVDDVAFGVECKDGAQVGGIDVGADGADLDFVGRRAGKSGESDAGRSG